MHNAKSMVYNCADGGLGKLSQRKHRETVIVVLATTPRETLIESLSEDRSALP